MRIDHLVVGCTDLRQGERWLAERLGVDSSGGGEHERYGTHNRLWRLDEKRYLELIALNRDAVADSTPPFGLSDAAVQDWLKPRPRLLTWVARVEAGDDDSRIRAACPGLVAPVRVSRGEFHWRLAIAADNGLCAGGASPYLIWWQTPHPTDVLPDIGLSLEHVQLFEQTPGCLRTLRDCLSPGEPLRLAPASNGLQAGIGSPTGSVTLD